MMIMKMRRHSFLLRHCHLSFIRQRHLALSTSSQEVDKANQDETPPLRHDSLSKLWQFSRPEWPLVAASTATLAVTSSITLLLPYASGQVIDLTIASDNSSPIVMAGGLFGLMTVSGGGVYLRALWLAKAGNRMVARLKQRVYQRLLYQPLPYLENSLTVGDALTRLSTDAQMVQYAATTQTVAVVRSLVMSGGSLAMLLYTSPTLAALSLCTLPPIVVTAQRVGRRLQQQQQVIQQLQSQATSLAQEALTGISTVKQFTAEDMEASNYAQSISKAHQTSLETAHMQAQLEAVTHVAANGAVLGVLGYGGTLVLEGAMTAGDLAGFVLYSFLLAGNLSSLSSIYADIRRAVAASERILDILDQPVEESAKLPEQVDDDPLHPTPWSPKPLYLLREQPQEPLSVDIQNLTFAYPSRPSIPILKDFSLHIPAGTSLSLVGGSGAGKSTLSHVLTRLYEVPRGCISLQGRDVRDYSPYELRRQIGIVSQDPVLFSGSIRDNIRYNYLDATEEQIQHAAELAHVTDFWDDNDDEKDATQLSGGQKQRVSMARVLLRNPPLIILDEATSALDARSEHLVQRAMSRILESKSTTVLSIAHRLSTIRHSDWIAVLQHGRIVQQGTFEDLARDTEGPFYNLTKTQLVDVGGQ
jgi:ATP-binding cassette subfamily B protein